MSSKILLLLSCIVGLYDTEGRCGQCEPGFHANGESCYWFSKVIGTYSFARSICEHLGSRLAIITSKSEDDFIRKYLQKYGTGIQYYLGGSDLGLEGTWRWEGGIPMKYTNWAKNEPNNAAAGEHCLGLFKGYRYKWNDEDCDVQLNFICEHAL